ncbi:hypothetical protein K438DRAFT_331671 [Mycena galopus ATCC 62051]|nr:hypothetical protein K438DRAFT_331671 [Mycena galopus ATCC 62051]
MGAAVGDRKPSHRNPLLIMHFGPITPFAVLSMVATTSSASPSESQCILRPRRVIFPVAIRQKTAGVNSQRRGVCKRDFRMMSH